MSEDEFSLALVSAHPVKEILYDDVVTAHAVVVSAKVVPVTELVLEVTGDVLAATL